MISRARTIWSLAEILIIFINIYEVLAMFMKGVIRRLFCVPHCFVADLLRRGDISIISVPSLFGCQLRGCQAMSQRKVSISWDFFWKQIIISWAIFHDIKPFNPSCRSCWLVFDKCERVPSLSSCENIAVSRCFINDKETWSATGFLCLSPSRLGVYCYCLTRR